MTQRRALVIDIDEYASAECLSGCVKDAGSMAKLLARHDDRSANFRCGLLTSVDAAMVTMPELRSRLRAHFNQNFTLRRQLHCELTWAGDI